jgi:hypothetical protein
VNLRPKGGAAACRRDEAASPADRPAPAQLRAAPNATETEIGRYLTDLKTAMTAGPQARSTGHDDPAAGIYSILTDRRFSHVSRGRAAACREQTLLLLSRSLQRGGPIPFWYDIGPGYHASICRGALAPSFEVGLSEWLVLHQIACFSQRVAGLYAPGARFSLVVDNLCALRTNDIPVEHTQRYCAALRGLIREAGLASSVDLFVESETFDLAQYDELLARQDHHPLAASVAPSDVENVARFLGRRCSRTEAARRIEMYRRATAVTERLLADRIDGVRMAQRASETVLGFRPFPGGDCRTQCGEVALSHNTRGRLHPILLTIRNIDSYHHARYEFPGLLPAAIAHVGYAAPRIP